MKKSSRWIASILAACLIGIGCAAFSAGASEENGRTGLYAGAGTGEIRWEKEVILANNEKFSGEYQDVPQAKVLLLEDGQRAAIVSLELVQAGDYVDDMIRLVSEELDVPESSIWIHCIHTTTTLHLRSEEAVQAVYEGLREACKEALASFRPAAMGIGTAELDINVNRNIAIPEGVIPEQWSGKNAYGFTGDEYSPKELTMLRFDAEDGEPIGFYLTYPMKPVGLDQSGSRTETRLISADIPGYA